MWGVARKKPVEVEYRPVNPEWFDSDESNQWCEKVHTHEGVLWAYQDDDYIIRGVEGELYPIKKRIFEKTYDVVTPAKSDIKRKELPCMDCRHADFDKEGNPYCMISEPIGELISDIESCESHDPVSSIIKQAINLPETLKENGQNDGNIYS